MAAHPESAHVALRAYATKLNPKGSEYQDPDWPEHWNYQTNLVDLLADLMHFADGYAGPVDFESALESARNHYEAELRGEA
jgi:hypothetical protein